MEEPQWLGWNHWLDQEIAKAPNDEMLGFMKELMNYRPEIEIPSADDLRRSRGR